ncbi:MAG: histidine kinase dimerization/phosphoacceptor domain -containing protein [Hyphomicrobiaceae bacterium]|nr:histidine kinase dimerization/phosphoacceptor domain -containing protein [Hyphomicrobiaceae bacterium]
MDLVLRRVESAGVDRPRWVSLIGAVEQLATADSLAAIIEIVRSTARHIAGADGITFVLRDGDRCHYVAEDAIAPLWKGLKFPMSACVSGWCMSTGKMAVIPDIYADERVPRDAYLPTFVSSMVMTPVIVGSPVAAIGAYWSIGITPDEDVIELLAALARSTGIAIHNVQLRQSLRESEARCVQFIEALPAAIYATDAAGRVTYFNQGAADLAGFQLDISSNSWQSDWSLYKPDGTLIPPDATPMARTLGEGQPVSGVEAIVERRDGLRVPVLPYPTPLYNEAGELTGAINMFVDISERKSAETAMRVLMDELNHRVKNNLQMLSAMLSFTQRECASEEAKRVLGEASSRVAVMAAAQRTLYVTQSSSRFEGRQLLDAVCKSAGAHGAANFQIQAHDGVIANDIAMPLALALNELVTNAIKHAAQDGGVNITVTLARANDDDILTVEDDGPGFTSTDMQSRSSGLGLVAALARQVRGSFSVEPGPGARCVMRFPVRAAG